MNRRLLVQTSAVPWPNPGDSDGTRGASKFNKRLTPYTPVEFDYDFGCATGPGAVTWQVRTEPSRGTSFLKRISYAGIPDTSSLRWSMPPGSHRSS
jgi:hypothetical protein